MRAHIITLAAIAVLTMPSMARAQSATIEFPCPFASSTLRIVPTAIGYNGASVPLTFSTTFTRVPKWEDNSLVISTDPISVRACRSVAVTIQGVTTITRDHPWSNAGEMHGNLQVVDAETGRVLQKIDGINTFMRSTKPGHDTSETRHLTVDLSAVQATNVVLRFTGLYVLSLHAAPFASIDNTPQTEIEQVH